MMTSTLTFTSRDRRLLPTFVARVRVVRSKVSVGGVSLIDVTRFGLAITPRYDVIGVRTP